MNLKSEQITSSGLLVIDEDQTLNPTELKDVLRIALGPERCEEREIMGKNVLCYINEDGQLIALLTANITYMGGNGQHPQFLKRIQLKNWYKEFTLYCSNLTPKIDTRFIGVYSYDENIIFADFVKNTYMQKKMNNSAAHIYTNDLYQATVNGHFKKVDKNGNTIFAIRQDVLRMYLNNYPVRTDADDILKLIDNFNHSFVFGKWLLSREAIRDMHTGGFSKWKETEWAGYYLEYRFEKMIKDIGCETIMKYIASSNKHKGELDFDLIFPKANFYGDLKASSSDKKDTPGNDQNNVRDSILKYKRFWYLIYEHDTRKDSTYSIDFEATRARANYIRNVGEWSANKQWDELSYKTRMKHSVMFKSMMVVELNPTNYMYALKDFNQGHQPSGKKRKPKFLIDKDAIKAQSDNFAVYRYTTE